MWTDRGGPFAEMVLFDLLSVAKAWEMLHDAETVGKLDTEKYLDLCLAAGYSREASERAARDWGAERLRKVLDL